MKSVSKFSYFAIIILLVGPWPLVPKREVEGIRIIYEWSRKFFDFVGASSLAQKFLSGVDPVTTVN